MTRRNIEPRQFRTNFVTFFQNPKCDSIRVGVVIGYLLYQSQKIAKMSCCKSSFMNYRTRDEGVCESKLGEKIERDVFRAGAKFSVTRGSYTLKVEKQQRDTAKNPKMKNAVGVGKFRSKKGRASRVT